MTLYLTTSTHRRGGNNGNNRAETMQKPTKKSRNNAFLAEKRWLAALGPSGRRFESCRSDQIWLWKAISEAFFFAFSDAKFEGRPLVVAPLCVMRFSLVFSSLRFPLSWFLSALRAFLRILLVSWHIHSWICVCR